MQIEKNKDGSNLEVKLIGRLDTTTSPELEKELGESLAGITRLVFDVSELAYISSAGLRVLLSAQKTMNSQSGSMVIRHASDEIMEIFEVTGFTDILTIEND